MVKKIITLINYGACGVIAILLVACLFFVVMRQRSFTVSDTVVKKLTVPKGGFSRSEEEYKNISSPALSLKFSPLSVQLPDLHRFLIYYGKNGRPDAPEAQQNLFFSFTGNKSPTSVPPGERAYVLYDKSMSPSQYVFSPNNGPTPLWITAAPQGNQAVVEVAMDAGNGVITTEPAAYAKFNLPEKEYVRFGSNANAWEIGKWRVDGTLFARQKGKWYGIDKFIERHSGEEYKPWVGKQRIDFGEGDELYSVYVSPGDCLMWDDDKWKMVKPGEASRKHVLVCVKKVDDRIMNLELWDVDGKGKITLNLVKANEPWAPQVLEQNFKFIGARTRSQFVFEINKTRMLLSPNDWLLLSDNNWTKLVTPQDIDGYVERKKVGALFVFERVERRGDRQVVLGTLYNAARTEATPVEYALQQGKGKSSSKGTADKQSGNDKGQKTKESNPAPMLKSGSIPPSAHQAPPYPQNRPGMQAGLPQGGPHDDEDDDEEDDEDDDD